ncbi:MAG TPA: hypothetical protein DDZ53_11970 [Firmicutes bacterium]|jgi:23S rRNA (guanine745-N1)-methyltransferase|nr:hypothetical protein [Bacillota bacterium]
MKTGLKKIDLAKQLFAQHGYLFACPVCGERIRLDEPATLRCGNCHAFDLARQGYVNLLTGKVKASKYDQALFAARLALNQSGFFVKLLAALESSISTYAPQRRQEQLVILDAGCGEGSHLAYLVQRIQAAGRPALGIGLDIAKDGIRLAASTYADLIWCVADLARSPLRAAQCDVILNILSPANYSEFKRLMQPDGIVIKVFPGPDYLQELRTALYAGSSKATYQKEDSVQQFGQQFSPLCTQHVYYRQQLAQTDLEYLLQMTPLAWNADEATLEAIRQTGLEQITVDTTIMIGK